MIVIADTTSLNYLVLIDYVEILPQLHGRVLIPLAVWEEFQRPETPEAVRAWIGRLPAWLEIRPAEKNPDPTARTSVQESAKPSRWRKNFTPTSSSWTTVRRAASRQSET